MTRRRLKARRDRRGGTRKAQAKRRATTLAGRAPDPDFGTDELRARRLEATTSTDLPNDLLGVLYGRGLIDAEQLAAALSFAALVRLVHLAHGLSGASPAGLWRNILSATTSARGAVIEVVYPGAETARRLLRRYHRLLGSELWHVVLDAVENVPPERVAVDSFVEDLRGALTMLAEALPRRQGIVAENSA